MECVKCVCVWREVSVEDNCFFWLYQSCGNRGSVGRISVFGLRRCRWTVGGVLGPWSGRMCVVSLDYLYRWQIQVH